MKTVDDLPRKFGWVVFVNNLPAGTTSESFCEQLRKAGLRITLDCVSVKPYADSKRIGAKLRLYAPVLEQLLDRVLHGLPGADGDTPMFSKSPEPKRLHSTETQRPSTQRNGHARGHRIVAPDQNTLTPAFYD